MLARVVRLIVAIVVLILVAGIVLVLLKANQTNSIVSDVHNAARWFAGPFDGLFSFHSARVALAVNWGLAAVVYAVVGGLIARLLRLASLGRTRALDPSPNHEAPTTIETVVLEAYVNGVPTRKSIGWSSSSAGGMPKDRVSAVCRGLD